MLSAELPGGPWYYTDHGPPDADLLVFVHGFTGSVADWDETIEHVPGSFRCVAVDLPGHGRTPWPDADTPLSMPQAAADLAAFVDRLSAPQTTLVGYSMGGRLALFAAVNHPGLCDRLVLESASPGIPSRLERQQREAEDNALADFIEREGMVAFVDRWSEHQVMATQQDLPDKVKDRLRSQRLQNNTASLAGSLRGMGAGVQPPVHDRLSLISVPTLLITGERDTKFTTIARDMTTQIPHARHRIVPEGGHNVHLEKPASYRDALLSFLTESNHRNTDRVSQP